MTKSIFYITIIIFVIFLCGCSSHVVNCNYPNCNLIEKETTIDGNYDDWQGVSYQNVHRPTNLWFGHGMGPERWSGGEDLSFRWAYTWYNSKLYFVSIVRDDMVVPTVQPNSFLNDGVEILMGYNNNGGPTLIKVNEETPLRGYEMHFLPMEEPLTFVDDSLSPLYQTRNSQNKSFEEKFKGKKAVTDFSSG